MQQCLIGLEQIDRWLYLSRMKMTRFANPKLFFASAKHYRLSSVTSTPLFTDGAPLIGIESFVASSEKQNAQNPDIPLLFNANERQVRMKKDSFFKVKMLLTSPKRNRLSSGNCDTPTADGASLIGI